MKIPNQSAMKRYSQDSIQIFCSELFFAQGPRSIFKNTPFLIWMLSRDIHKISFKTSWYENNKFKKIKADLEFPISDFLRHLRPSPPSYWLFVGEKSNLINFDPFCTDLIQLIRNKIIVFILLVSEVWSILDRFDPFWSKK